jgi:hypothetical protein
VAVLQVCSPATPPLTPNPEVRECVGMEDELFPVGFLYGITNMEKSENESVSGMDGQSDMNCSRGAKPSFARVSI